jgi:predicted enzyme related to lactoylglutathione lyase
MSPVWDRPSQLAACSRVEWDYPEGADFVVLADPEGNLFCVIEQAPRSA